MGDLNIDLLKFQVHHKTNTFIDDTFSNGFSPLITKPTRVTELSGTLIDHAYSNLRNSDIKSGIIIADLSDHFGIFVMINKVTKTQKSEPVLMRSFKEQNINKFQMLLTNTNFNDVLGTDCPQEGYDKLLNKISTHFDSAFPLKLSHPSRKVLKCDPWINDDIKNTAKTKAKLYRKKLKNPSITNIENYKEFCKTFNKDRRLAKMKYYRDTFELLKHDIKQT